MKTLVLFAITAIALALAGPAEAQDHAHGSPHGGQVKTVGKYHVEALLKDTMLHVYLLDEKEKPLPPPKAARAVVQIGKAKHDLQMAPSGEMLMATLPADAGKQLGDANGKAVVVVTITLDGKPQSARFKLGHDAHKHK